MNRNGTGYERILEALDDETLYTASTIAVFAKERGLLVNPFDVHRVRLFFGRQALLAGFPTAGDGRISRLPAWRGKRWKTVLTLD
ncbi:MAG: hypothetical protein QNK37_23220 [Acidobacteriota bacterium]|nr:hypothetical protein [Acidobacteriota bacterium]